MLLIFGSKGSSNGKQGSDFAVYENHLSPECFRSNFLPLAICVSDFWRFILNMLGKPQINRLRGMLIAKKNIDWTSPLNMLGLCMVKFFFLKHGGF